jgi:hypothetical protein
MGSMKVRSEIFLYLLILGVLVACSPQSAPERPVQTPTPPPTPQATNTQTPTIVSISSEELSHQIQSEIKGELTHLIYDYQDNPGEIFARWDMYGDSTNERIAKTAKEDSVAILGAITQSDLTFTKVIISGWYYWTVDINNTIEYNEFFRLHYDLETLEQINWETVRSQYIWLVADKGEVHWLLEN